MRHVRRLLGLVALVLLGVLAICLHQLLYTQGGLEFALAQLHRLPGIAIDVTGAKGTLAGPLSFDRLVVDHEAAHIDAQGVSVVSDLRALLIGRVTLDQFVIGKIEVRLKERPEQPPSAPHFLPPGLSIRAPSFRVGNIDLRLKGGQRIPVEDVRGTLALTRWRLDLDPLAVRAPDGQLNGTLALRATEPLGLRTNLRGHWKFPQDTFEYVFALQTSGNLDRLAATLKLDAPAQLSFSGTLLDLTEQPRANGTFRAVDFDGSPWLPAGRFPRLSGSITLAAGAASLGMDGTMTTPALEGQQIRLQGSGRWADSTLDLASLRVWLPRTGLEITSAGKIVMPAKGAPQGTLPHLALNGDWTALRWPLVGDAAPTIASPQGVYSLEGALPYALQAKAKVEGTAIPSTSFSLAGTVDKEQFVLHSLDGYALRGRIRGRGRLSWTGAQPWRFEVNAQSLAISELRPGIEGRINVAGAIDGVGLTADAAWTARLQSLSGSMFNRPLTGVGEISHREGYFEFRNVRVANGESHVDVNGRVGTSVLDLRWDANLKSLAFVQRGMEGQLVSNGHALGTPAKPEVTGKAHLTQFAFNGIDIANAELNADVDGSDRHRSTVALVATDIGTGGMNFQSARLRIDGYAREHSLALEFDSPGDPERSVTPFSGRLRAEGAVDVARKSWQGNLVEAAVQLVDGAATLIQPAALELSPDAQRAAPLCLRTGDDARVCIEGEHKAKPLAWRVIYSAQDWPLKRLLRTFLGWHEFDGQLQASGWAEQTPGKDWVGGTTFLLAEPSFDVPRNKFRTERIKLGGGRLDLFAEADSMRAALDFTVDETTHVRGEALVSRRTKDLLASPLQGRITAVSDTIKVLPLVVPEIDRAAGKVQGEVALSGTLGAPEFNGDFHLREGRLELYRTNLVISNLVADGKFIGEQLTFGAHGDTARGKLTVDGDFHWPKGVMTGAMHVRGDQLLVADTPDLRVFATPDLTLRAGVGGYEVEGEIKIPTARISPRELTSSVGTSPDERVVGVDVIEEDTEPSTADRIRTSVRVTLGDAVRVDMYGLKARLDGNVLVTTVPADVPRGQGTINVVDGQYKAFGQDVKITKGTLSYRNTPLNEPLLEIVAERAIKDTDITVGVNVRGTLDQPFITLSSTPAMSDNETLSYLLTGRSIDTLQSGEAQNVNKAAENLAVSGGSLLLGGIGTRLGLDEVSLERDTNNDTSVVLGKALSPKLFVSYGISIAEAINTIKLRYTLNKKWSIKAESGLEQSADVEYRIER